jgi:transposase
MPDTPLTPTRWIGLDVHKHYLVAMGVDQDKHQVFGPQRVEYPKLEGWIKKHLTQQDAVVLEMTTNTYQLYDELRPHVASVTVVHPPHVALIVRAQVKTDQKAALALAQLHCAGLLPAVWIPPADLRDLRALIAQRTKMSKLATQAKNRLQALLQRYHILPPEGLDLYAADVRSWWLLLPVTAMEKVRLQCDLDTLAFAKGQVTQLEQAITERAASDERVPLLIQLPGIGLLSAMTLIAAIGDVSRFPSARQLVGYAGLGTRVHDSGQTHHNGRITKAGRKDIRWVMVEAAHHAVRHHPHWQAELARLEPRLGRNKALVAIARKLLVSVWHVLTKGCVDRFAEPEKVAQSLFGLAYDVGVARLPDGHSAKSFTREQLDRLGIGADLEIMSWGTKQVKLPPSRLKTPDTQRSLGS